MHEGSWSVRFGWARQVLDTPYVGSSEIANPLDRRTVQDSWIVTLDYGLRERINLGLLIPYRSSRVTGMVEGELDGLGDIGFSARFGVTDPDRAKWKLAALGLVTFPTGEVETALLDQNIALGVGAISLGGGLELTRDWPKIGSLLLRTLGGKPTGASDDGVRFGGTLSLAASYGRAFRQAGRARWALSSAVSWTEPDTLGDETIDNRGGRLITGTLGFLIPISKSWETSIGITRLLDADVHGDQLVGRWSGFLGFRWLWERPLKPPVLKSPGP